MRATLLKEGNCACALCRCTCGKKKHITQTFFDISEYMVSDFSSFSSDSRLFPSVRMQRPLATFSPPPPLLSTPDSAKKKGCVSFVFIFTTFQLPQFGMMHLILGFSCSSILCENMYVLLLIFKCQTCDPVEFSWQLMAAMGLISTAYRSSVGQKCLVSCVFQPSFKSNIYVRTFTDNIFNFICICGSLNLLCRFITTPLTLHIVI